MYRTSISNYCSSATTSSYNTGIFISHFVSFSKGSEARQAQPCHPLIAAVVMVTIWKARPGLTLPIVVGSVRTSDISHSKQKRVDILLSVSALLFSP